MYLFLADIYCTDISGPCELSQRQEILKDTVTLKWCTTPKAVSNIGKMFWRKFTGKIAISCADGRIYSIKKHILHIRGRDLFVLKVYDYNVLFNILTNFTKHFAFRTTTLYWSF